MRQRDFVKQRIAVLSNYLEQREATVDQLYRTLRLAAEAGISADDIKKIASAIECLKSPPWDVKRELEQLRKGEIPA